MRLALTALALAATAAHAAPPEAIARAGAAAQAAARTAPACTSRRMGDFYWEIGDAHGALASGSPGGSVDASTSFAIASASKWIFSAYVVQKKGIETVRNDASLLSGLRFTSGYTDFKQGRCLGRTTVGACFRAGTEGHVGPNPDTVNTFFYESGHDQKLAAVDLGLADLTAEQLTREMRQTLNLDESLYMAKLMPLLAGGMQGNAEGYAKFLRELMSHRLVLGAHLGENAVCAQPKVCPAQAKSSPLESTGEPWSYSYGHWVESAHGGGTVDAYSSPGAFGFYPWITPDGRFYGVLSRHERGQRAAVDSVQCGRAIREAFLGAL